MLLISCALVCFLGMALVGLWFGDWGHHGEAVMSSDALRCGPHRWCGACQAFLRCPSRLVVLPPSQVRFSAWGVRCSGVAADPLQVRLCDALHEVQERDSVVWLCPCSPNGGRLNNDFDWCGRVSGRRTKSAKRALGLVCGPVGMPVMAPSRCI